MLGGFELQFVKRPGRRIELYTLRALTFDDLLEPQKYLGVDGLWAGVPTTQAPRHGREQKQREGPQNHQENQIDRVLRPQYQVKEIELALVDIKQDRLTAMPGQPAQTIENDLGQPDENPSPPRRDATDRPWVNLGVRIKDRLDRNDLSGAWLLGHFDIGGHETNGMLGEFAIRYKFLVPLCYRSSAT